MDILKLLQNEIKKAGISRYRISKESGVPEYTLCRLMQGVKPSIETAQILLQYFGYSLRKDGE